jgi:hypothetical protein
MVTVLLDVRIALRSDLAVEALSLLLSSPYLVHPPPLFPFCSFF